MLNYLSNRSRNSPSEQPDEKDNDTFDKEVFIHLHV